MNASAAEILGTLQTLGVKVTPIPPDTLRLEPASKVPADLLSRIRESKAEILAALVPPTLATPTGEPELCQHCDGAGVCACPACTLRRTSKPTPCSMCRWEEHRLWLAATRSEGCWHCGGNGKCGCIACERMKVCGICGGSGKAPWIQ
jgi:hypothetical protein